MLQIWAYKRPLFYDFKALFWGSAQNNNFRVFEGQEVKLCHHSQPAKPEEAFVGRNHKTDAKSIFGVGEGALGREHKTRKIALIGTIRKCKRGIREWRRKRGHDWKDEWIRGGDDAAKDCEHYELLKWWTKYLFWQGNLGSKLELNYSFSRLKLIVLKFKFVTCVKVVSQPQIIVDFILALCSWVLLGSGEDSGVRAVCLQDDVRYLFKIIGMKAIYFR